MHKMTQANLEAAFAGESQAHVKYLIFADQAEKEGLPNVARLFRAISYAEQVHATNHFKTLGHVGKSEENLAAAIAGKLIIALASLVGVLKTITVVLATNPILAIITAPKQALPTGMVIYMITRTILNGTRSVDSLVMAIVFVI